MSFFAPAARLREDHPREGGQNEVSAADPSRRGADAVRRRRVGRLSEDEQNAVFADYQAINQTPGVSPGVQMQPPETATTVRVQDGTTLTTDGPFVAVKEALGGYPSSRPTTSTPRSSSQLACRRPGWAVPWRYARSWSADHPRASLPRRVGPRPRRSDRLSRRLRPRRGSRPGGLRLGRRTLAARRDAGESPRLADDHRAEPRDRPHPPRPHARREDTPARRTEHLGGRVGRRNDS